MKKKPAKRKLSKFSKATKKFNKKKLGKLRNQKTKPRVDPLWTLDDGITYSILSKFDVCRHRFHIAQVQGWKPKKINYALEFGNIFHHLVEAQDRGIDNKDMGRIVENYVQHRIETSHADSTTITELSIMGETCLKTFEHYVVYWQQNPCFEIRGKWYYEKDFNWIGKEIAFDVKYRMPNGRVVRLRGKQDGKFNISRKIQGNWLFETKTKGRIDPDGITKGLHKDLQTGLYMTAMQIMDKGVCPQGVLYNVIRRTQLKPRVNEKASDFAKRVEEDIQKRPEWYFMRWSREITEYELENFKSRQLNPALYQITTWWDSIAKNPMNPFKTTCDGKEIDNLLHYERPFGQYDSMEHGRGDFFDIIADENYFQYEQKQYAFPELEEEDDLDQYL
jgi:hypothetical protein